MTLAVVSTWQLPNWPRVKLSFCDLQQFIYLVSVNNEDQKLQFLNVSDLQ